MLKCDLCANAHMVGWVVFRWHATWGLNIRAFVCQQPSVAFCPLVVNRWNIVLRSTLNTFHSTSPLSKLVSCQMTRAISGLSSWEKKEPFETHSIGCVRRVPVCYGWPETVLSSLQIHYLPCSTYLWKWRLNQSSCHRSGVIQRTG